VRRSNDNVDQAVPTGVAVMLIGLAILATTLLIGDLRGRTIFPPNHGVAADAPEWMQCMEETIERHPSPFTTADFENEFLGARKARVEGTYRTMEVEVVQGSIVYPWIMGSGTRYLDCPGVGLISDEMRRERAAAAAAARPCEERYGLHVVATNEAVVVGTPTRPDVSAACGHRGWLTLTLVDDEGAELVRWWGRDTPDEPQTEWRLSNWCHDRPTVVHVSWDGGETSEPFGPSPACQVPTAPLKIDPVESVIE
jgi:hypothetical protein